MAAVSYLAPAASCTRKEKGALLSTFASKLAKAFLVLAIALSALCVTKPTAAYALTGTKSLTFQTGGGWTTPSVTLRQNKSVSQLRSYFSNRTATKKYYCIYRVYVDGKYKGKFDGSSMKVKLPRNGWHTVKVVEDGFATSSRASKVGYFQTNRPTHYWDVTNYKNIRW